MFAHFFWPPSFLYFLLNSLFFWVCAFFQHPLPLLLGFPLLSFLIDWLISECLLSLPTMSCQFLFRSLSLSWLMGDYFMNYVLPLWYFWIWCQWKRLNGTFSLAARMLLAVGILIRKFKDFMGYWKLLRNWNITVKFTVSKNHKFNTFTTIALDHPNCF